MDAPKRFESFDKNVINLYHGSKTGLNLPIKPESRSNCDFGSGFYLGDMKTQPIGLIAKYDNARLYSCSLDLSNLSVKKFGTDRDSLLEWAMFVAYNRGVVMNDALSLRFSAYNFDVIIGLIADDSMMQVMSEFFNNAITDKVLIDALKYVTLGNQYVCKTELACSKISILSSRELLPTERTRELNASNIRMKNMSASLNSIRARYRRDTSALYYDEIQERLKWHS